MSAFVGCKTPSGAALRSDDAVQAGANAAGSLTAESFANSRWMGSFQGPQDEQVEVNLEVDGLSGRLIANIFGNDNELPFALIRLATEAEIEAYVRDVTKKVVNSQGQEVPVTSGLVLADGDGKFLAMLPIVTLSELVLYPFGPLQRTGDMGEADAKTCGGMTGVKCAAGSRCQYPAGATADSPGKCVPTKVPEPKPPLPAETNGVGSRCGGPGIPCPAPLVCRMTPPPKLHGFGTCVQPAPVTPSAPVDENEGRSCGGFAGSCPAGYDCSSSGFNQPGRCHKSTNQVAPKPKVENDPIVGRTCGGFSGGCPQGYRCNSGNDNKVGECEKAPAAAPKPVQPAADPVIGRSCGGFAGSCPQGYKCSASGFNQPGQCLKGSPAPTQPSQPVVDAIEGRSCGGFAGGCPSGYKCSATGFNQIGACHKN